MSILKPITATVFGLALMGAVFSPSAKADEWNRKTKITFSGPVEIPGVHLKGWGVLPAGTYVFKIVDSMSDRHIVQIFNADETQVFATILAIPNYRLKECCDAIPALQAKVPLTIRQSISAIRLKIWDEQRRQLIAFH